MADANAQKGSVLFLTLIILSVLTVVVIQGMRTMQVRTAGATLYRNGVAARRLALSGIRLAQALLYQDMLADQEAITGGEQAVDTLIEDWAVFPNTSNTQMPEITNGEISLEIIDEQGKYPLNRLAGSGGGGKETDGELKILIAAMLLETGMEKEKSQALARYVVWGFKDWMDENRETSIPIEFQGGQAVNVEELDHCRNAPLTQTGEVRVILEQLGLPEDLVDFLYYGDGNTLPGLKDLLTVIPSPGVNINTAHPLVLQAIARDVEEGVALPLAEAMDEYRRDAWNRDQLSRSDWYRDLATEGSSFVTFGHAVTRSNWFMVRATGRVGAITHTGIALLARKKKFEPSRPIADNVLVVWVRL